MTRKLFTVSRYQTGTPNIVAELSAGVVNVSVANRVLPELRILRLARHIHSDYCKVLPSERSCIEALPDERAELISAFLAIDLKEQVDGVCGLD